MNHAITLAHGQYHGSEEVVVGRSDSGTTVPEGDSLTTGADVAGVRGDIGAVGNNDPADALELPLAVAAGLSNKFAG